MEQYALEPPREVMKNLLYGLVLMGMSQTITWSADAEALNMCHIREAERCYFEQSGRPDSTRGGQTVSDYCTSRALIRCSGVSR